MTWLACVALSADHLIEATPENILQCMHWVNDDLSARGTTDINAPLQRALKLLTGAPGLPFVFLLTDGEFGHTHSFVSALPPPMHN